MTQEDQYDKYLDKLMTEEHDKYLEKQSKIRSMKKLKGSQLEFISLINRDGKGITDVRDLDMGCYYYDNFTINSLSMTEGTYIASGFITFIVRIKKEKA